MKFLKKLFSKKTKEVETEPEENKEVSQEKEYKEEVEYDKDDYPKCAKCGRCIFPEQKQTFMGKKFHKQCLRRIRKDAKKQRAL